jgi:RecA/RadA recombinase
MSFLSIAKAITENPYATIAADGIDTADIVEYVDTGCYILNGLLSGDINGGLPSNKITALAGESSTGKTFFTLGICKHFLSNNPLGNVVYFESESAVTKSMLDEREIPTDRFLVVPLTTVQEFATQTSKIINEYEKDSERTPLMMCLDSAGMLSTRKEMEDTTAGKETKDMTRAPAFKGAWRVLTLRLARAGIPMIVTNHTYDSIGSLFPTKEMGGGSGLKYAASTILYLSKKKEKVGNEVIGNIIHCKTHKSRLTKENKMVDVLLTYESGLDKYYGLLDIAEKYGIIKKVSNRYELPDGGKHYGKVIYENPEKYFTDKIMEDINIACKTEFLYGN